MHKVYVLESLKSGKRYVGYTRQELDEKLKEHNYGATEWSRAHKPFKLVHSEIFEDGTLARQRENFFKTGRGRKVLGNLICRRQCANVLMAQAQM